jgi:hypothetical protein
MEYTKYRYGWNWFHIPLLSIVMGIAISSVAILVISMLESQIMGDTIAPLLKDVVNVEL